jgi:predicted site-specific integrase-resolvase
MYANSKTAQQFYGVSPQTLRRWSDDKKINFYTTKGGHRRYELIQPHVVKPQQESFIYARVSSKKQEDDLDRQIKFAQDKFPEFKVISDIGSGINFKRKGFTTLLDKIISGKVKELVVTHKDRLCRFGFDIIQLLCKKFNTKLTILSDSDPKDASSELTDDLMAIITVFSSRYYGKRKYTLF